MRLFLGLLPPLDLARAIHARARGALGPIPAYAAEDLHVTLVFLGQLGDACADAVQRDFEGAYADAERVVLRVGGTGAFGVPGHERALWAGIDHDTRQAARLADLVARGRALAARSLVPLPAADLERPYLPHLTLARPRSGQRAPPAFAGLRFDLEWEVEAVHLFESAGRERGGPRYPVRATCPLRGL